jgi:hypothetical protein
LSLRREVDHSRLQALPFHNIMDLTNLKSLGLFKWEVASFEVLVSSLVS